MSLLDLVRDPSVRGRKFTSADIQRMLDTGLLGDKDRSELVDGELIERPLQGPEHLQVSVGLFNWVGRRLPEAVGFVSNSPLRLSSAYEPEPDLYLYPAAMNPNAVRGPDTLLVAEVAKTSMKLDRMVKAPLYAQNGVGLYWIVDIDGRVTLVHRLEGAGYGEPEAVGFDKPLAVPDIAEPLIIAHLLK